MYWGLMAAAVAQEYINNKERDARVRALKEKLLEVKLMLGDDFFNNVVMEAGKGNGFDAITSVEKVIRGLEKIAQTKNQKERVVTLASIMRVYETDCEALIFSLIKSLEDKKKSEIKKMLIQKIIIGLKMLKNDIDEARAYVAKKGKSRRNGWIAFWVITAVVVFAFSFAIIMIVSQGHDNTYA